MEKRKSSELGPVFTDILGPMLTTSLGGNRYAISFTDSYSMYSAVYFLKSKTECLDNIKVFCVQVGTPRAIRSENGKEYTSKSFGSFCISNRIKREHTDHYRLHQNCVSECRWRTSFEMTRCMQKTATAMNFGLGPYTLLFTFQIVASQLVYKKVKRPSKCSLVKNQNFLI